MTLDMRAALAVERANERIASHAHAAHVKSRVEEAKKAALLQNEGHLMDAGCFFSPLNQNPNEITKTAAEMEGIEDDCQGEVCPGEKSCKDVSSSNSCFCTMKIARGEPVRKKVKHDNSRESENHGNKSMSSGHLQPSPPFTTTTVDAPASLSAAKNAITPNSSSESTPPSSSSSKVHATYASVSSSSEGNFGFVLDDDNTDGSAGSGTGNTATEDEEDEFDENDIGADDVGGGTNDNAGGAGQDGTGAMISGVQVMGSAIGSTPGAPVSFHEM